MLWQRDLEVEPRTIYVNLDDTVGMTAFVNTLSTNATAQNYMGTVGDPQLTEDIIRFVHGEDITGVNESRSRKVKVDLDGDGETSSPGEDVARVWKLGDILNSSPKISSSLGSNNKYDTDYGDGSYKQFKLSDVYKKRGMVYAGGNDGMLHAFKLGYLSQENEFGIKSTLYNSPDYTTVEAAPPYDADGASAPLGYEQWAFIPKNVLPYLKYTLEDDYCHIYMVDLTVQFADLSLCQTENPDYEAVPPDYGNTLTAGECAGVSSDPKGPDSWRTVLIGGMRYGGSCKPFNYDCAANSIDTNGDGDVDEKDCVVSPNQDVGLSSYFALDITDDSNPKFMWEFSHPNLGYSTVQPNVVRFMDENSNKDTLGKWYAIIGSGPTGPIDKDGNQFVGSSDQSLKVFVLDLRTGEPVQANGLDYIETNINNAFAFSQSKFSAGDIDGDALTDVLYIGYASKCSGAALPNGAECHPLTWRNGGILRILTNEDDDPSNWNASVLIEDVGPVTTAVAKMYDTWQGKEWVYFGTGRYMYERVEPWTGFVNAVADDESAQRNLFGIIDPCTDGGSREEPFPSATTCTDKVTYASLIDATTLVSSEDELSWRISLEGPMIAYNHSAQTDVSYGAERVLTNVRVNENTGTVFATTFKPYSDECSIGGESFLWATDATTGGVAKFLKGVAVMQVSTGNIKKIDLSKDFVEMGGKRTIGEVGVSSQDPPKFSDPGQSLNRMLHILERKE